MIIVVTGGRDFAAANVVYSALDTLHQQDPITLVAHGACGITIGSDGKKSGNMRGADRLGGVEWTALRGAHGWPFYVDHALDGPWPAAGPRRNERMLRAVKDYGATRPPLVVAFDGGRGTASCIRQALGLGLRVCRVHGTGPYWTEILDNGKVKP